MDSRRPTASLGTPGIVLTDDYNPIDFYDVWLKEWERKNILDNIEMDVLI